MKKQEAWHRHDFVPSGSIKMYGCGHRLEACALCGWPFDEHPDHPNRKPLKPRCFPLATESELHAPRIYQGGNHYVVCMGDVHLWIGMNENPVENRRVIDRAPCAKWHGPCPAKARQA